MRLPWLITFALLPSTKHEHEGVASRVLHAEPPVRTAAVCRLQGRRDVRLQVLHQVGHRRRVDGAVRGRRAEGWWGRGECLEHGQALGPTDGPLHSPGGAPATRGRGGSAV